MSREAPFKVLVAGGGPAAVEAVLTLRELAPNVALELIAPGPDFVYRPFSVLEPFARAGARRYPLSHFEALDVTVRQGAIREIDPGRHVAVTESREELSYDGLLVAIGAHGRKSIEHALTFGGPDEAEAMHGLIGDVAGGEIHSLAFVAPPGPAWPLPLYELALQSAERARAMSLHDVIVTIASSEQRPLDVFGETAADLLERLLSEQGIAFVARADVPTAERLVSTELLSGRPVLGLPADAGGFLPVDSQGRVAGVADVWAAGDGTDFAIKEDGLAAQQAETAARSIAAAAGNIVEVTPFEPVLRGLLVAGGQAWYLRRRLDGIDLGQVSARALWWPPSKIAGRRLAPFLDRIDAESQASPLELVP